MEENIAKNLKPSAGQAALYYGLLLAVGLILVHLILFLAGIQQSTAGMIISLVVFVTGIAIVTLDYRNKKCGGYISYGRAVKIGFLSILFASFMVAIYTGIYHSSINPGDIVQAKIEAANEIYNMGMAPEQEKQALQMQEYIHTPLTYAIGTVFSYALMGILAALIISIFIKKEEKVSLG